MRTNGVTARSAPRPPKSVSSARSFNYLVAVALLGACAAPDVAVAPSHSVSFKSVMAISDGVHSGGNSHFFFLPPMVAAPITAGVFDEALAPVLEVCEWTNSCGAVIARFSSSEGTGSSVVRVDALAEHYIVNWNTQVCVSGPCTLDPEKTYRIRVSVSDLVLGYADVDAVANGSQLKNVQTGDYIGLVEGKTLPVKFRIERGIVGSVTITPNPSEIEVGETIQLTSGVQDLHGEAILGQVVNWASANQSIAAVTDAGLVLGVAVGCTNITATVTGVHGFATVCVTSPPVIDVATANRYRTSVADVFSPMLAEWSDGTILVASLCCGATVNVSSPSAGVVTKTPFGHLGNRPTIWIPQTGPYPEIALSHYDRLRATTRSNSVLWDNMNFGCCGVGVFSAPIDPATGILWRHSRRVELDLRTGMHVYVYNDLGDIYHDIYTTPAYIWEVRYGTTTVIRRSRSGAGDLPMGGLPAVHRDPSRQTGALTAAQGYVHVTPDGGGTMIHFTASGLAWSKSVPGVTAPVITATDLVVVGSTSASGSYIRAYNLTDGAEAWSVALSSEVKDLVIGDLGNVYVLQATKLLALDALTGALRKTYINLPNATEMILSQGTMHVVGPAELIGIDVESQGYDLRAPWPVRFGDNQRTTNLPLSRVR